MTAAITKVRDAICGTTPDEESSENHEKQMRQQKNTVKGILSSDEETLQLLNDDERDSFHVEITTEELEELVDLDCFKNTHYDFSRAKNFAMRHSDAVTLYIRITDTEDTFLVKLSHLYVRGEALTNDIIQDFATSFRMSIHAVFDPLAEDGDEPSVSLQLH